jgi:hypothetical protein
MPSLLLLTSTSFGLRAFSSPAASSLSSATRFSVLSDAFDRRCAYFSSPKYDPFSLNRFR